VKIKEIIAQARAKIEQVRSKLGDEEVAKLNSDLKAIESGVTDLQEDILHVNGESKGRKEKIREYEKQIADKDDEIEDLKKKTDTSELTKEVETLREFKSNTLKGQRDSFGTKLKVISKHPKFENMKGFYKLPDPDKDGNYNLSEMEDADLEFNIAKIEEHEAAGIFGKVDKQVVDGSPRSDQPGGNIKPSEVNSEADLEKQFLSGFDQFDS
jgi:archaellum component FlaC